MIIKKLDSNSGDVVISLSIFEISTLTNALYQYVNSKSNVDREVKELHKDLYLCHWLAKEGHLCSDDLKIASDMIGKGENLNGK